jgi:hypothetical protein
VAAAADARGLIASVRGREIIYRRKREARFVPREIPA